MLDNQKYEKVIEIILYVVIDNDPRTHKKLEN